MYELSSDGPFANPIPKEKTAYSYLSGAQMLQEIPVPCKPEMLDASQTSLQSPDAELVAGQLPDADNFRLLLQQVELQYCRDMCQMRALLESSNTGGIHEPSAQEGEAAQMSRQMNPTSEKTQITQISRTSPASPTSTLSRMIGQIREVRFPRFSSGPSHSQISAKITRATHGKDNSVSKWLSRSIDLKTESELGTLQRLSRKVVYNVYFDTICAAAIMLNSTMLGVTTDIAAKESNPDNLPIFFSHLDRFFSAWFLCELSLRLFADGLIKFLMGPNWSWNIFDCLVVFTDVIETSITFMSGGSGSLKNLTALRMLRVLRIVRALRVVKLVHFGKELRMMVFSVLRSSLSLLWSMILLLIIVFIFGVYLVQNVTAYLFYDVETENEHTNKMKNYFGSLRMACYILFQCISGGISWGEVGEPLMEIHWSNALVLCFFVFFTVFALLNIVTGIFVDTALNSANADRDEVIQDLIHHENSAVYQLYNIFHAADTDQSGTITLQELQVELKNDRLQKHLVSLDIELHDATAMFHLLDMDKSGEVSIEEFIFGCLKMKGLARSIDIVSLIHETRWIKANINNLMAFTKDHFKKQTAFQETLNSLLTRQPYSMPSFPLVNSR